MTQGIRPDGQIFASDAGEGELEAFPATSRGWGVTIDGKDDAGNVVAEATNGIPPMEWDNGQRNKVDNNIWWLMQHAIPEWQAGTWDAGAFVRYSDEVYYNAASVETTGEPGVSTDWKGVLSLTGAIDGRYLQVSNNLSEIAAKGTDAQAASRTNLALGNAATHNVTSSNTDITADQILKVGDYGLSHAIPVDSGTDLASFFKTAVGAFYHCDGSSSYTNAPSFASGSWFDIVLTIHESTDYRTLLAISSAGSVATAAISAGGFSGWVEQYDTSNPPPSPPAPDLSAYMKTADANAKFVQGIQFGASTSHAVTDNQSFSSAGYVLSGYNCDGNNDDLDTLYAKPLQININGTWVVIPG